MCGLLKSVDGEWGLNVRSIWELEVDVWEDVGWVADVCGHEVVEDVFNCEFGQGEVQLGFEVWPEQGCSGGVVVVGQLLGVVVEGVEQCVVVWVGPGQCSPPSLGEPNL